ncbi:MAG: hypothetical protein CMN71_11015 [Sphingomonadaceae bacterium]|nr:hypothetical protein [Sphingomonadaceae bacterium]
MRPLLILFLFAISLAAPTSASVQAGVENCIAALPVAKGAPGAEAFAQDWRCDGETVSLDNNRIFLRIDAGPTHGGTRFVTAQRGVFERIHVVTRDTDGRIRSRSWKIDDLTPVVGTDLFKLPTPPGRDVVVAIDRLGDPRVVTTARLVDRDPAAEPGLDNLVLLIAALAGMLVMPLIFGMAVYQVLRQKFVFWHFATATTLLATVLINSGLLSKIAGVPMGLLVRMALADTGFTVAATLIFATHFVERDAVPPRLRKLAIIFAGWALFISVANAVFPLAAPNWQFQAYHMGFVPILAFLVVYLATAARRGSRYVWYLIVGLAPLMLLGGWRLLGQLSPIGAQYDTTLFFYIGCVFEEVAVTLGVADRLLTLRRERDLAIVRADELDEVSRHDSLTGLLNRRALDDKSEPIVGSSAIAILDIDYFKAINDTYGHIIGDRVLCALADVLRTEPQTRAIRLGGEEFLIQTTHRRPEKQLADLRQAVAKAIASHVPEIEWQVTCSMGVIILAGIDANSELDYETLYSRCDVLLYRAKDEGRDRMVVERLAYFERTESSAIVRKPRAPKDAA